MFVQYDVATGAICATNSMPVDDAALAALGRAQLEADGDVDGATHRVDLAGPSPVVVPVPAAEG